MIIAAVIIFIGGDDFVIVDPISTFVFSFIVLATTKDVIQEAISILMEGTPVEVEIEKLKKELTEIEGVTEIHDMHVWSLSANKLTISAHIISD